MTDDDGPAGPIPPDAALPPAEPAPMPPAEPPAESGAAPVPAAPRVDAGSDVDGSDVGEPDAGEPDGSGRRGAHRAESAWQRFRGQRDDEQQAREAKPHRKAPWWELPVLVAVAIAIAILVKTFVVQPFYIPSESMEKTLHGCTGCHGDRILVNKVIYDFRDPHPGDIVVFHAPRGWDDEPGTKPPGNPVLKVIRGFGQLVGFVPPDGQVLVKRVIATGGQTVWGVDVNGRSEVHVRYSDGHVKVLNEPYVWNDPPDGHATFGPVTVPKGRLWVMGDHRGDSLDSRFHCASDGGEGASDATCDPVESTVPVSDVIGKAFVIAWPPSRWRTLGTPSTFKSAALAGASDVPGMVSASVMLPLFVVRRRRRRR